MKKREDYGKCQWCGDKLEPIFWRNPDTGYLEIDVLVCRGCLAEYPHDGVIR